MSPTAQASPIMQPPCIVERPVALLFSWLSVYEVVMIFVNTYALPKKLFSSPPPVNSSYEHMTIAVFVSLAATNMLAILPGSPLYGYPTLSYRDMQMVLLTVYAGTSFYLECWGSGGIWLASALVLWGFRLRRWKEEAEETREVYLTGLCLAGGPPSSPLRRSFLPSPAIALRVVQVVLCALLWAGPALAPWEQPAPYVRWYPLNKRGELLWRGLFGVFATALLVASSDPWRLNRGLTGFFVVTGVLHATTMLGDNLRGTQGNSNAEHRYGDILGWYLIALLHAALGPWAEWWADTQPPPRSCSATGEASWLVQPHMQVRVHDVGPTA